MECFLTKEQILNYEKKVVDKCNELKRKDLINSDPDHPEKTNPIVVALLVDDKLNETWSYRSEMLDGDHAEFNLFTNKLDGTDQSSKILFVSLEPCTHDSRLTTISCSEIIGKARIKKIFMGTFDPDPLVRYEGYLYLKAKGAEIEMFDEKLARELITINEDFYNSKLGDEEFLRRFKKEHEAFLDEDAIAYYFYMIDHGDDDNEIDVKDCIDKAKNEHKNLIDEFYEAAKKHHYIFDTIENSKRKVACEFGFMQAFYKAPSAFYKGSKIKVIDYTGGAMEHPSNCSNKSLFISAMNTYFDILNIFKNFKYGENAKHVFRELLLNAVCHKNYKSYAPITVSIYNDKIKISNPFVVEKIDVDRLNKFNMPSNPVNGCFGDIASDMRILEGQGRGANTLKRYIEELKNKKMIKSDFNVYESACDVLIATIPLV